MLVLVRAGAYARVRRFRAFYFEWLVAHADNATGYVCPGRVRHAPIIR